MSLVRIQSPRPAAKEFDESENCIDAGSYFPVWQVGYAVRVGGDRQMDPGVRPRFPARCRSPDGLDEFDGYTFPGAPYFRDQGGGDRLCREEWPALCRRRSPASQEPAEKLCRQFPVRPGGSLDPLANC